MAARVPKEKWANVGDKVKMKLQYGSGLFKKDAIHEVTYVYNDNGGIQLDGNANYEIPASAYEVTSCSREQGEALIKRADSLEKEAKELRVKGKKLLRYKDDEEELADMIAECFKSGGDKKKVYKLLKASTLITKK